MKSTIIKINQFNSIIEQKSFKRKIKYKDISWIKEFKDLFKLEI